MFKIILAVKTMRSLRSLALENAITR